jgi:hypothetical protein
MSRKNKKLGGPQKRSVNHSVPTGVPTGDNNMSDKNTKVGGPQKWSVNHSKSRNEFYMLCERIQKSPLGTNVLLQIVGKEEDTDDCFLDDNEGTNTICDYTDGFRMYLTIHNNVLRTFDRETIIQIAGLTCNEYFEVYPRDEYKYLFKMDYDFSMGLLIQEV